VAKADGPPRPLRRLRFKRSRGQGTAAEIGKGMTLVKARTLSACRETLAGGFVS